jgi:hypothetical protein
MSNSKQDSKVRVRTGVKAGPGGLSGVTFNHGVRVRTGVKAGGVNFNHGTRVRHSSR